MSKLPSHLHSWRRWSWPAYRALLEQSSLPILAGPFYGEVGFEALYWQPLIANLIRRCGPDRVIPICRGQTGHWYGATKAVELYLLREPREVRIAQRMQRNQLGFGKQDVVSRFDREVIRDAAHSLGIGRRYHVLHPAWMYHRCASYWTGHTNLEQLMADLDFKSPVPAPPLPAEISLPELFIAAKFYGRPTFPLNVPICQQFVNATLETVAAHTPVVLLHTRCDVDEHPDFKLPTHERILDLRDHPALNAAETSLQTQSAILGRSQGFVGSYGGLAQLALRMGKPSVSFYLEWQGTSPHHHLLSEFLSLSTRIPYQVFQTHQVALTRAVLPQVDIVPPKKPVAPVPTAA